MSSKEDFNFSLNSAICGCFNAFLMNCRRCGTISLTLAMWSVHWAKTKPIIFREIYLNIWVIGCATYEMVDCSLPRFDFPDEERLFNGEAPDSSWEQFAIVATDLLERIQSSLSYTNSPYASGDEEEIEGRPKAISRENFKMWLAADS